MDTLLVSQIFGAVGVVALCLGYVATSKSRYLFYQIICNAFYMCQYLLLGVFPGAAINIITLAKSGWFLFYDMKDRDIPKHAMFATLIVTICVAPFVFDGTLLSLVPIILSLFYTVITWQNNLRLTYSLAAVSEFAWFLYNITVGAYAMAAGNILAVINCGIGLHRLKKTNYTAPAKKVADSKIVTR